MLKYSTHGPSVLSALRVYALANQDWLLTGVVMVLSMVPIATNLVVIANSGEDDF